MLHAEPRSLLCRVRGRRLLLHGDAARAPLDMRVRSIVPG